MSVCAEQHFDDAPSIPELAALDATSVTVSAFGVAGQVDDAWQFDPFATDHVVLQPGMLHGLPE